MRQKVAVLLGLASAIVGSLGDFTPTEAGRHRRQRSRCCQCCPPVQMWVPPTVSSPCPCLPGEPGGAPRSSLTTWYCVVYPVMIMGGETVYYVVDCSTSTGYWCEAQNGLSTGNCSNPSEPNCFTTLPGSGEEGEADGCPLIHPTYRPLAEYPSEIKLSSGCRDTLPDALEVRFQITENEMSREVVARVHYLEMDPAKFDPPRAGEKVLRGGVGYEVRRPQGTPQKANEVRRVAEGAYCVTLKVGAETRKFLVSAVQR